ncbi:MAG TPA: HNH endonuclease domain-containing protein [Methanothrix sp.]|nr:HNH endonuclease domain-containing protein [Methanothrix sp.]
MIKPRTKTKTKTKTTKQRDYKKEYRDYHGKPEQIKKRDMRNKARRMMEKEGRVRKGDGKEVDHKVPLSKGGSNSRRNLRIVSRRTNRKKGNKRG